MCCGAERTKGSGSGGSGSGACGAVRAATSFLHIDPVYRKAVDVRASGCIGDASASALAAMHEDAYIDADVAADGDVDEPPFT